jgi:hypothetical protein
MSEWAYYLEPEYYDKDISAECFNCEKESDAEAKIRHEYAYWLCPLCNYENEKRIM